MFHLSFPFPPLPPTSLPPPLHLMEPTETNVCDLLLFLQRSFVDKDFSREKACCSIKCAHEDYGIIITSKQIRSEGAIPPKNKSHMQRSAYALSAGQSINELCLLVLGVGIFLLFRDRSHCG